MKQLLFLCSNSYSKSLNLVGHKIEITKKVRKIRTTELYKLITELLLKQNHKKQNYINPLKGNSIGLFYSSNNKGAMSTSNIFNSA